MSNISCKTHFSSMNAPAYLKEYLSDILHFNNMPLRLLAIIQALFKRIGYDNRIVINGGIKQIISDEIGSSVSNISNSLGELVRGEILIRESTGVYILNPLLFGEEDLSKVEGLKLEITYNSVGRMFKTIIDRKKDEIKDSDQLTVFDAIRQVEQEQATLRKPFNASTRRRK